MGKSLPGMDEAYNLGKGYTPESEIMRAIMLRAIEDYKAGGDLRQDALDFMFASDEDPEEEDYVFSFHSICNYLGFHPVKTRQRIMKNAKGISTRRRAA